jgi:hypothetical protein
MLRLRRAPLFMAALPLAAVALSSTAASAHEISHAGGYQLAIGWLHEPSYVGVLNAVQVIVRDAAGNAIDDLNDGDLKVQVSQGALKMDTMPLHNGFDADTGLGIHGDYEGAIVPTVPGDYTFHVTGSIHGTDVDHTVTSSDSTFDAVRDPSAVEFPVKAPTNTELSTALTRLQPRADTANTEAGDARDAATRATLFGGVALGLGLVALIIAIWSAARLRAA